MKGDQQLLIIKNRDKFATPLSIILIVIGFLSTPLTLIILYATLKLILKKSKKTSTDLKISLGILIIDFIISLSLVILGFISKFKSYYIVNSLGYCGFTLIFYMNQTYISIYWVGLLSLERGLLIIHNIKLSDKFWLSLMLGQFSYFLILASVGISKEQISVVNLIYSCMITPNFKLGKICTLSYLLLMMINYFFMIYCYLGISIKLRLKANNDIIQLNLNKEVTLAQTNRTVIKVLAVLVIYLCMNTLELITLIVEIKTGITRPSLLDFISTILLSTEPIINSLILVQFHESVKLSMIESFPILNRIFKVNNSANNDSLNQNEFNGSEGIQSNFNAI